MITFLSFILVLGILIFVHELGHFLVAKSVGIKVEKFSLGFPPRMVGKKIGDTEYMISWIPLGGYVEIAGLAEVGQGEQKLAQLRGRLVRSKTILAKAIGTFRRGVIQYILCLYCLLNAFFHRDSEKKSRTLYCSQNSRSCQRKI